MTLKAVKKPASRSYIPSEELADYKYARAEIKQINELTDSTDFRESHPDADNSVSTAALLTAEQERVLFRRLNFVKYRAEAIRSTLHPTKPSKKKLRQIEDLLAEAESVRQRIVESNTRLVMSIARKRSNSPQQFDEFLSDGLMILLGAIDKFDYSRGFRFSTYATHSVQRHFYRLWKTGNRRQQRYVLTPNEVLADVAGSIDPEVNDIDTSQVYRRIISHAEERLDGREKQILRLRFGLGPSGVSQTLREIAGDMGISKERVRQLQIKAVEKLRDVADELNLTHALT